MWRNAYCKWADWVFLGSSRTCKTTAGSSDEASQGPTLLLCRLQLPAASFLICPLREGVLTFEMQMACVVLLNIEN